MPIIKPYKGVSPKIHESVFVAENAVIIGNVEIGENASVWYNCVVRGDVAPIRIGKNTNIQDGTIIHTNRNDGPAVIGDNVTVGHMAMVHACSIGDDCLIGMQSCILDFARVQDGAYVAAGAIVTPRKMIEAGQLWAGNPAKYLRDVSEKERAFVAENAAHYVRLAVEYKA